LQSITRDKDSSFGTSIAKSPNEVAPIENAVAALQEQIEQQKTERKQERFFWFFTVTALLNVLFSSLAPWHAATVFLIFSLIGLIGLAKWLEVPWVVTHLERWFDRTGPPKPSDTE